MRLAIAIITLMLSCPVAALEASDCAYMLSDELTKWEFAELTPGLKFHTVLNQSPMPLLVLGDFDGDKIKDAAFLIKGGQKGEQIAVCLSSKPRKVTFIEPGCSDLIDLIPKGKYPRDAIGASCYEVTQDTWLYKDGAFTVIPGEGD